MFASGRFVLVPNLLNPIRSYDDLEMGFSPYKSQSVSYSFLLLECDPSKSWSLTWGVLLVPLLSWHAPMSIRRAMLGFSVSKLSLLKLVSGLSGITSPESQAIILYCLVSNLMLSNAFSAPPPPPSFFSSQQEEWFAISCLPFLEAEFPIIYLYYLLIFIL